jgi:hypothetical protein
MTIDDLQKEMQAQPAIFQFKPEYARAYLHKIPQTETVNRVQFIIDRCAGKTVLHVGCAGPLHGLISKAAKKLYGIDRVYVEGENIYTMDVERDELPQLPDVDLVVCAEILEHLSNPGSFLDRIRLMRVPMIVTVPNAFCDIGPRWLKDGYENVNAEHVCYYSYMTAKTLLERHGFEISEWYWAGKKPYTSESLVFVTR